MEKNDPEKGQLHLLLHSGWSDSALFSLLSSAGFLAAVEERHRWSHKSWTLPQ